jgi:hypothetical protein
MIKKLLDDLPVRKGKSTKKFLEEEYYYLNQLIYLALILHEFKCNAKFYPFFSIFKVGASNECYFGIDVQSVVPDEEFFMLHSQASLMEIFGLESAPTVFTNKLRRISRFLIYAPLTTQRGLTMLHDMINKLQKEVKHVQAAAKATDK